MPSSDGVGTTVRGGSHGRGAVGGLGVRPESFVSEGDERNTECEGDLGPP